MSSPDTCAATGCAPHLEMNIPRTSPLALAMGLAVLSAMPMTAARAQVASALAVIVSQDTPVDGLSRSELRRVFLGRMVSKRGVRLIPLNHPIKSPVRALFDQTVLNLSADEAGRHWVSERIRGARTAPKSVGSRALLVKVVSKIRGVISYIPSDRVPAGLKVVPIDGRWPDNADYPIKR